MRKINGITYLGLVLNTLILAFTGASEQYKILFIPTAIAYMLCVLGIILILINRTKVGSIIFYIGSILFIPIGVIGIMGIRKTISDIEEYKFNKENYG